MGNGPKHRGTTLALESRSRCVFIGEPPNCAGHFCRVNAVQALWLEWVEKINVKEKDERKENIDLSKDRPNL